MNVTTLTVEAGYDTPTVTVHPSMDAALAVLVAEHQADFPDLTVETVTEVLCDNGFCLWLEEHEVTPAGPTWPESDAERSAFTDWQYEVAAGDTVAGFRDWLAARP